MSLPTGAPWRATARWLPRLGFASYVLLLVGLPLVALVHHGLAEGLDPFWRSISAPVARAALALTLGTSALVAVLNTVLGTITAWVLVRYRFRGRATLSALVDLPFAIPTLVAGLMIVVLYGPNSLVGRHLEAGGLSIVFAPPGIVLALLFVTLPFVIRAVSPVLLALDPAEEEAATVLGAGPWRTFRAVHLPAIAPAAFSGGIRALGRAMGEFGAVVIVAGNIPYETLTAPVFILGEVESDASGSAAAISTVLLAVAVALHGLAAVAERKVGARRADR